MKKNFTYFLLFLGMTLFFYWQSLFAFFQADEWYYFTQILPLANTWYGAFAYAYKSVVESYDISSGAHLTPISNFLYALSVQLFTFSYWPYALSAIIIHAINAYLIYLLIRILIPNKKNIAIIAGLFFAVSYAHQQAVTWVMTYLWTELAATFFLLWLLYLFKSFKKNISFEKNVYLSFIFLLFALLTKESSFIALILLPIIFLFKNYFLEPLNLGEKYKQSTRFYKNVFPVHFTKLKETLQINLYARLYVILLLIYIPYRLLIPKFFLWININYTHAPVPVQNSLDPALLIFRAITYPLRAIVGVFIPPEWIMSWIENLTSLAYPTYAVEKAGRGLSFLTFTQSAGSDLIIYPLAIIFLFVIFISLRKFATKDKYLFRLLLLGFIITVFSVEPLLLVATYAPWWGYSTFIDSRHLYITSIGAAMIFSLAVTGLANRISKKNTSILVAIFVIWACIQYSLLENALKSQLLTATQRRTIVDKILQTVPPNTKKKVILIESNMGYYGFDVMPPFQTHLGQILSLYFYQKHELPEFFIHTGFLTKNSLRGEGYVEEQGKGFGYYIDPKHLHAELTKGVIMPEDVYAFSWDGTNNTITDITSEYRAKSIKYLSLISQFKDWHIYKDTTNHFLFKYPPNMQLTELPLATDSARDIVLYTDTPSDFINPTNYNGLYLRINLRKKLVTTGTDQFAKENKNSDGNPITDTTYTYRVITTINEETLQTVFPTTGTYPKYFIPFPDIDKMFEITAIGKDISVKKFDKNVENILSTITYIPVDK